MHIVLWLFLIALINGLIGLVLILTVGLVGLPNTIFSIWCPLSGAGLTLLAIRKGWVR